MKLLRFIAIVSLLNLGASGSLLSWMFGTKTPNDEADQGAAQTDVMEKSRAGSAHRMPFEMKSAEQRFLKAGEEYMAGLSELDTCHHMVISELEMSCNDITEEELGKLGVALLNCQSKSEGRPTFTCTREMTLAQCTQGMDATMWNTYHIISDRSRSVCYGVRQQHFQRQTRWAVNQLASTAEDQLYVMEGLREGQDSLHTVATDTLEIMTEGQKDLLGNQRLLKDSQGEMQDSIRGNLAELANEKALISAGNRELASMTEDIKLQLDNATKQLLSQDQALRRNHDDIQRDLANIRIKAAEVWDKLDGNMHHVSSYHAETAQYYQETIANLKRMNDTINYLLNLIGNMQAGIDERLGWLTSIVGGVGDNLNLLITCVTHVIYFLLASLAVTFLHTPTFSRILLLLLVPLNAVSEVRHGSSLDFSGLTVLIVGVVLANLFVLFLLRFYNCRKFALTSGQLAPHSPCQCNYVSPKSLLPPDVSRTIGGQFSDDEEDDDDDVDYTLPTDLSAITSENTTFTFNGSSTLSEPRSTYLNDTGASATCIALSALKNRVLSMGQTTNRPALMSTVSRTPIPSTSRTPMPTASSSILSFAGHPSPTAVNSNNPAKRQIFNNKPLDTSMAGTPSPRRSKEDSTPTRVETPSKRLCSSLTKTGQPCRLTCAQGTQFCFRHTNNK